MADIEAERTWMRRHAEQQAIENDAARRSRDAHDRTKRLSRCQFCSHARHHDYLVAASITERGVIYDAKTDEDWELAMIVRWCSDNSCLCGVDPCGQCGDRSRNRDTEILTASRCPACSHEWQDGPIA